MPDREILVDMAARVRTSEEHDTRRHACPSLECAIHDEDVDNLLDHVENLEEKDKNRKESRRTWTDYVINGFIGFGSALIGFFAGKGG